MGLGTTSPAYKLTVNSDNGTDNLFQVATTTNQRIMVINNQGNVGIGTTSPTAILQVVTPNTSTYATKIDCQSGGNCLSFGTNGSSKWQMYLSGNDLYMYDDSSPGGIRATFQDG